MPSQCCNDSRTPRVSLRMMRHTLGCALGCGLRYWIWGRVRSRAQTEHHPQSIITLVRTLTLALTLTPQIVISAARQKKPVATVRGLLAAHFPTGEECLTQQNRRRILQQLLQCMEAEENRKVAIRLKSLNL